MSDLNLTDFLKESTSDLSWLEVDEEIYRSLDTLPKQNLDSLQELQYLWDKSTSKGPFIPNTADAPRTLGDMSSSGPLREVSESLLRTARILIMQTDDLSKIGSSLKTRFDRDTLIQGKTALSGVLSERGLLGRLYIDASDFPNCSNKGGVEFVNKYASAAPYILAKPNCSVCIFKVADSYGIQRCSVFNKQLEIEIPYSPDLALKIEANRVSHGIDVVSDLTLEPKERIRKAFLSQPKVEDKGFTGLRQEPKIATSPVDLNQTIISIDRLTHKKKALEQETVTQTEARPVIALIQRELLKGRSESELARAMKVAFTREILDRTKKYWVPVFKEAGLYGSVYTTQDSFENCQEGSNFLSRHSSKVKVVVAGSKCSSCMYNQGSYCLTYGRELVANAEAIYTNDTLNSVVVEHKSAGTLPSHVSASGWSGGDVRSSLKEVYRTASTNNVLETQRTVLEQAFVGSIKKPKRASELLRQAIVKTASQYMNEGLYGEDLQEALSKTYTVSDILDSIEDLRVVLAEQGLQGIKYIDPTVYDDYGKGCNTASRLHRGRAAVKYSKVGEACVSCVHHIKAGYCSVLAKELVSEPPYVDKEAEQFAILNSGKSTEVSYQSLINNGAAVVQEYQIQSRLDQEIEYNPEGSKETLTVELGNYSL